MIDNGWLHPPSLPIFFLPLDGLYFWRLQPRRFSQVLNINRSVSQLFEKETNISSDKSRSSRWRERTRRWRICISKAYAYISQGWVLIRQHQQATVTMSMVAADGSIFSHAQRSVQPLKLCLCAFVRDANSSVIIWIQNSDVLMRTSMYV